MRRALVPQPEPRMQPLSQRFRRHAAAIAASGRSPLTVALIHGAADDLDAGGVVSELFDGVDAPPGSVPALRLLAALHRLVLAGHAPELARHYPSVGGTEPPARAWPRAAETLRRHRTAVRPRLERTVQTNEPGRAAVLFGALLWLTARHPLPVRLVEVGASAGLNLHVDRFAYVVGGERLGAPASALTLAEPWHGRPVPDAATAAAALRIVHRAGCDPHPVDASDPEQRLDLLAYVWPDELDRLQRLRTALAIAAAAPVALAARSADDFLAGVLPARPGATLTVVWQSVVQQYLDASTRARLDDVMTSEGERADARRPLARLTMEPSGRDLDFVVRARVWPPGDEHVLGRAGAHGPPVRWLVGD